MSNANATETRISKLPKTGRRKPGHSSDSDCACCNEKLLAPAWFVVTEQGEYPVGVTCAERCKSAGFEIVPA